MLVRGVTKENYALLGKQFIAANEGGFVVAERDVVRIKKDGEKITATPRQWGAWLTYLHDIGYKTEFMKRQGYYTVPAEWPHLFDAGATVQGDFRAAEDYVQWTARHSVTVRNFDQAARRSASKRWFERSTPTPTEHLELPPEPDRFAHIDISDLPDRV